MAIKSKTTADNGFFFAPYVPYVPRQIAPDMNWQDYLRYYQHQLWLNVPTPTQKLHSSKPLTDIATEDLQRRWPGNYIVEEYYDSINQKFSLRLKFGNPTDETFWLLKNT